MKVKVQVAQLCPILCDPMDFTVHRILQARTLEWVVFPFSRGFSQPRDRTQVSRIAGSSLYQLSHKGSPRILEYEYSNINSLSLLQSIFLTQELNRGLLHCRWILYQLSYLSSPRKRNLRNIHTLF